MLRHGFWQARCLSLVSQLRLPNVQKLVEVGPQNELGSPSISMHL